MEGSRKFWRLVIGGALASRLVLELPYTSFDFCDGALDGYITVSKN